MPMPTKYRPEMCRLAHKVCLLGATDKQLADLFEVHETNLREWKQRYPEFALSIRTGKDEADARVAQALYVNATRFRNVTAQIFWLKNRRPDVWRDRHDYQHTGAGGGPIEVTDPLEAGRRVAFAITRAAIDKAQREARKPAKEPA